MPNIADSIPLGARAIDCVRIISGMDSFTEESYFYTMEPIKQAQSGWINEYFDKRSVILPGAQWRSEFRNLDWKPQISVKEPFTVNAQWPSWRKNKPKDFLTLAEAQDFK